MTLRETLLESLSDYDVRELKIDRDEEERGTPVVQVTALVEGRPVTIRYARQNGMTSEDMANVLKSYLRRSLRD